MFRVKGSESSKTPVPDFPPPYLYFIFLLNLARFFFCRATSNVFWNDHLFRPKWIFEHLTRDCYALWTAHLLVNHFLWYKNKCGGSQIFVHYICIQFWEPLKYACRVCIFSENCVCSSNNQKNIGCHIPSTAFLFHFLSNVGNIFPLIFDHLKCFMKKDPTTDHTYAEVVVKANFWTQDEEKCLTET